MQLLAVAEHAEVVGIGMVGTVGAGMALIDGHGRDLRRCADDVSRAFVPPWNGPWGPARLCLSVADPALDRRNPRRAPPCDGSRPVEERFVSCVLRRVVDTVSPCFGPRSDPRARR
ncbi:hypothetical protein Acsp07_07020 [Actinomycetospora sp. NBRC 106378]|nr:hypothetical protein Acsp07_07020 [Actinomycetospora sp. NBRC 106378]